MQVHRRCKYDVRTLSTRLTTQQITESLDELRVPRRALRDPDGHHDRGRHLGAPAFAAHTIGTVGHLDGGQARLGKSVRSPTGRAGDQRALVLEGQLPRF